MESRTKSTVWSKPQFKQEGTKESLPPALYACAVNSINAVTALNQRNMFKSRSDRDAAVSVCKEFSSHDCLKIIFAMNEKYANEDTSLQVPMENVDSCSVQTPESKSNRKKRKREKGSQDKKDDEKRRKRQNKKLQQQQHQTASSSST